MIEISVPETIKVGGIDYEIRIDAETAKYLRHERLNGESDHNDSIIRLDDDRPPQVFSRLFLHEVLHAIGEVYDRDRLEERDVQVVAQGLLQVMEQLGVRFVKRA